MDPSGEPLAEYREVSPGLRRTLILYSDKVDVTGRTLGGIDWRVQIPLAELVPDFGFVKFRSRRCVVACMLFAVFSVFLWLFLGPFQLELTSLRVVITFVLAIVMLGLALLYFPKYTAYRFVNKSGMVVLDVIEAGPNKMSCLEFVEQVSQTIRRLAKPKT